MSILVPVNLMEATQLTSIPNVRLYDRSNQEDYLAYKQLPEVPKFNPFFSIRSFQSNRDLYNKAQRSFISNLFIIAERLDRLSDNQENEVVGVDVKRSIQKPTLPPEMWFYILGFVQRLDMNTRPAALDNNDQDEDEHSFVTINDGADNGFCVERSDRPGDEVGEDVRAMQVEEVCIGVTFAIVIALVAHLIVLPAALSLLDSKD